MTARPVVVAVLLGLSSVAGADTLVPGLWKGHYETRNDGEYQADFEVGEAGEDQATPGITMILPEVEEARYPLENIELRGRHLNFRIKTGKLYKQCRTTRGEDGGYRGQCRREGADERVTATGILLMPPTPPEAVPDEDEGTAARSR